MIETENDVLKQAKDSLAEILQPLPEVKLEWDPHLRSSQANLAQQIDFTVDVSVANHVRYTFAVEAKSQGHPRQLRDAINQLLRFRHRSNRADYLVVAAPFISPEGAAICREEGIGYYDFAGNCRLVFGNTYIERTGHANPFRKAQDALAPSLYGPKSERVLRVLFHGLQQPWKVIPLAEAAKVSTGTVSVVRNALLEREWAKEANDGLVLTQPKKLLKDWAAVWGRRRERPRGFFTLRPLAETEQLLANFAREHDRPYALTGTAGAWHLAPMTRYNRTQIYWEGDAAELMNAAGLKPADQGANVHVYEPRDEGVFYNKIEADGIPIVAPLQLYLDLSRDPARGEEAAEHLWTTVLFPDDGRAN